MDNFFPVTNATLVYAVYALSCSPVIKTFVKETGGVDQFDCTAKYIGGHNPDLVLNDPKTGELIERVDLTQYKSADALFAAFRAKGVAASQKEAGDTKTEL